MSTDPKKAAPSTYNPKVFAVLTASIDKARTGTVKQATSYLKNNVMPVLAKKVTVAKGGEKKLWDQTHNLVVSYLEGVASGDVDPKDLRELANDLRNAEKAHYERLQKTEANRKKAEEANRSGWTPEVKQYDKSGNKIPEYFDDGRTEKERSKDPTQMKFDPGEGSEQVFHKYEHLKSKIIKNSSKAYLAVKMPLCVVAEGIPDMAKLKKSGLCTETLFGYPVIQNQLMIGFNILYLKEFIENWDKYEVERQHNLPRKADISIDWEAVEKEVAGRLRERTGREFVIVGRPHKYGHLTWQWFADTRDLRRLAGTMGSGNFNPKDWTFPFESERPKHNPRA